MGEVDARPNLTFYDVVFRNCGIVKIIWHQRIVAGIAHIVKWNGNVFGIVEKRLSIFISHGGVQVQSVKNFLTVSDSPEIKLVQLHIVSFKEKCGKRIYQWRNGLRIIKLGHCASARKGEAQFVRPIKIPKNIRRKPKPVFCNPVICPNGRRKGVGLVVVVPFVKR